MSVAVTASRLKSNVRQLCTLVQENMWRRNSILAGCLVLAFTAVLHGQKRDRSVVLPESAAQQITQPCSRPGPPKFDGTWRPTKADIDAMESRLTRISRLRSKSGIIGARIEHPDRYYRQYVGIIVGKRKLIYINAICGDEPPSFWRERPVMVCDGGGCSWGVVYDIVSGEFSHLELNGEA